MNAREPFKNSAESTMKEYGKGMPTDPTYYTKLSVKSIKDALLKSKPVNEVIEQVADPSLRKYQRRGSQDVTVAPTTDTHEVVEYKLSNVASTIDGIAIKKELTNKGVHVMRSEVGEDKLTQIRTGQGTLLVREEKNKAGNSEPATKLNKLGIGATNEAKCFTNRYAPLMQIFQRYFLFLVAQQKNRRDGSRTRSTICSRSTNIASAIQRRRGYLRCPQRDSYLGAFIININTPYF